MAKMTDANIFGFIPKWSLPHSHISLIRRKGLAAVATLVAMRSYILPMLPINIVHNYFIKTSSETPRASAIFLTVSIVGFGVVPASILVPFV